MQPGTVARMHAKKTPRLPSTRAHACTTRTDTHLARPGLVMHMYILYCKGQRTIRPLRAGLHAYTYTHLLLLCRPLLHVHCMYIGSGNDTSIQAVHAGAYRY